EARLFDDLPRELADEWRELDGEEAREHFVQDADERVQLGGGAAEEVRAELVHPAFVDVARAIVDVGRRVLERGELLHQARFAAHEDVIERLLGEAHLLRFVRRAANLVVQLALEEEAREALRRLAELSLEDAGELVRAKEAGELLFQRLDQLDFDLR